MQCPLSTRCRGWAFFDGPYQATDPQASDAFSRKVGAPFILVCPRRQPGRDGTNCRRCPEQRARRMPDLRLSACPEFRRSAKPVNRVASGHGISGTRADCRNQPCLLPVA